MCSLQFFVMGQIFDGMHMLSVAIDHAIIIVSLYVPMWVGSGEENT